MVEAAREVALVLVGDAGGMMDHPDLADEVRLFLREAEADYLMKS